MNETAGRSNVYRSSDSTTHVGGTGTHPPRSSMPRVATLLREREAPRAREEEEEEAASACLLFLHGGSHVVLAILVFAGGEGGLEAEADAEVLDELRGDVGLPAVEVVEDAASLGDEADEAAARGVVLGIFDDVLCDVLDPGGEEGHLDLRAAAVRHVPRELLLEVLPLVGDHALPRRGVFDDLPDVLVLEVDVRQEVLLDVREVLLIAPSVVRVVEVR
mmetsp:Transcript_36385/g.116612  ORF Transcript_36385/g.116612 Transcript_36385/m.116612 type:complete len:219 (-) Transcript_36385:214-870(-)